MQIRALCCDAAEAVAGKVYALGGWPSSGSMEPAAACVGRSPGVVFEVPADRVGRRLRIVAQLGSSDHLSADSWTPVTVDGRPVRVERSFAVERPTGAGRRGPVNVPFVLELLPTDLGRGSHAGRLGVAGEQLLLPFHHGIRRALLMPSGREPWGPARPTSRRRP